MTIQELREKRAKAVADARAIIKAAEAEGRQNLNADEKARWDVIDKEIDSLGDSINVREKQEARERELETTNRENKPETIVHRNNPGERETREGGQVEDRANPRATPEYRKAFESYLRGGFGGMEQVERRALSAGAATEGGYTYPSEQFQNTLIKFVDNMVAIRSRATVNRLTNADSLGAPSLDADPADPAWTVELGTGDEDSTMAFGKRVLTPHPFAKRIKVSETLLQRSVMNIDSLVAERLGYKAAVTEEQGFMTGTGANQPLGLFTAHAQGISTSRDVSTDNTTTALTADGLINAKYSIKGQYWSRPGTAWIFHRDAMKSIRKLKDGNGQYIWQPGLTADAPDRLLEVPIIMSEYAPNTFTTGLYVGLIGDLSFYWIADAMNFAIKRLVELYAETNQVGFIIRKECDGMPVLEEAFARVKLA